MRARAGIALLAAGLAAGAAVALAQENLNEADTARNRYVQAGDSGPFAACDPRCDTVLYGAGPLQLPAEPAQVVLTATLTYRTTRGDRARLRARVNPLGGEPQAGTVLPPGAYRLASHGRAGHTVTLTWAVVGFAGEGGRWEFWLEPLVTDADGDGDARFRSTHTTMVVESWTS